MANFFAKPKAPTRAPSKEAEGSIAGPSTSEFQQTFKPFVLKKDAIMAPTNWFVHTKTRKRKGRNASVIDNNVIVIEDGGDTDVEMQDVKPVDVDVSQMNTKGGA